MSTTNNLPPTLPLGTPSTEWAKDTQNLLEGKTHAIASDNQNNESTALPVNAVPSTAVPVNTLPSTAVPSTATTTLPATTTTTTTHPSLQRGESKDTVLDIPGGWGKENPDFPTHGDLGIDTDRAYNTVTNALNSAAGAVQAGFANLTSPADTSTNRELKASGPVGAPAHPSSATAGIGDTFQGGIDSLLETARNAVNSLRPTEKPVTEEPAHVVGLLPAPPADSNTADNADSLQLKSGGAKINTSPPTTLHPTQSDSNPDTAPLSHTKPTGPSPVDALPAGETRANLDTAHAGNYAYTDLPTKEGNVTDPHAGEPGTGYLDQARAMAGNLASDPVGKLAGVLTAVGLGGAAAAAVEKSNEVESKNEVEPKKEVEPVEEIDVRGSGAPMTTTGAANFLAPEGVTGSSIPVDEDVQRAVSKSEGKLADDTTAPTVDDVNAAAKKEHDAAAEVGGRPTGPIHMSSNPIQTTSNTHESKAAVATSPATAVTETGIPHHDGNKTMTESFKDSIKATTKDVKPGSKDESKPAVTTTTNTAEKAAPATSPATAVEARTNPSDAKASPSAKVAALPAAAPAPGSQAVPAIHTDVDTEHSRGLTDSTTATTGGSSVPESPSKGHKRGPSLKDRLKGEMKVLTGKLSRNDAKVEEGRALKSGGGISAANSPVSPAMKK